MKYWNWTRNLFACAALATSASYWVAIAPASAFADDKPAEAEAADKEEAPADPFAVPADADVAGLLAFIERIEGMRPTTPQEMAQMRAKAGPALQEAAKKIIETETDKNSEAYKKAYGITLQTKLGGLRNASPEERKEFIAEFKAYMEGKDKLVPQDAMLMRTAAMMLEMAGDKEAAADAYKSFGAIMAKSDNPQVVGMGKSLEGAARRATLVGNEMELTGTTLTGEEFDWKSYRGKVVLIDFWATWCGPCRAEHPNILKMYEGYKNKGFDVVGISLDRDRGALEKYLEDHKVEWTTLHEKDGGGGHPAAVHYGVSGIPTMILVGKDGKVVSTSARGAELTRLLGELLGEPEASEPTEEAAK